jgi:hypothetical protein
MTAKLGILEIRVFHYCETNGETVLNCVFYNVQINQKSSLEKIHFHKRFHFSVFCVGQLANANFSLFYIKLLASSESEYSFGHKDWL